MPGPAGAPRKDDGNPAWKVRPMRHARQKVEVVEQDATEPVMERVTLHHGTDCVPHRRPPTTGSNDQPGGNCNRPVVSNNVDLNVLRHATENSEHGRLKLDDGSARKVLQQIALKLGVGIPTT